MSSAPAEAPVQQPQINPAVAVMTSDNPEITSDFLRNAEDVAPGEVAGMLASAPGKTGGAVSAEAPAPAAAPATPEPAAPVETSPGEPAPAAAAAPAAEVAPGTEPAPGEPAPTTAAAPAEPGEPDPEGLEPEGPGPKRIKLRTDRMKPLDRKVALLMANGMEAEAALAEARRQEGVPAPETAPADPLAEARAELEAAMAEHEQATKTLKTDDIGPAMRKIVAAQAKLSKAESRQEESDRTFQNSVARAKAEWPESATTKTVFGRAVRDMLADVRSDPLHPLHNNPDVAYKVAQEIAKELGKPGTSVAAATTALTAPPATPVVPPKVATKPKPAMPVSGATPTLVAQPSANEKALAKAKQLAGDDAHLLDSFALA